MSAGLQQYSGPGFISVLNPSMAGFRENPGEVMF